MLGSQRPMSYDLPGNFRYRLKFLTKPNVQQVGASLATTCFVYTCTNIDVDVNWSVKRLAQFCTFRRSPHVKFLSKFLIFTTIRPVYNVP